MQISRNAYRRHLSKIEPLTAVTDGMWETILDFLDLEDLRGLKYVTKQFQSKGVL